jgi:hypothetical protein
MIKRLIKKLMLLRRKQVRLNNELYIILEKQRDLTMQEVDTLIRLAKLYADNNNRR